VRWGLKVHLRTKRKGTSKGKVRDIAGKEKKELRQGRKKKEKQGRKVDASKVHMLWGSKQRIKKSEAATEGPREREREKKGRRAQKKEKKEEKRKKKYFTSLQTSHLLTQKVMIFCTKSRGFRGGETQTSCFIH